MEQKFAHQCDNQGYLMGKTPRQHSPAEPGVWLVPAGATLVPPPEVPKGQRAKFNWTTQAWSLEAIPLPPAPPTQSSKPLPDPAKAPLAPPPPGMPSHEEMKKLQAEKAAKSAEAPKK
jgi:hypothetical protein